MADYWTDKRVTITGGAGFIGSHLALDLVNRGSIVRIADNLERGRLEYIEHIVNSIEFMEKDLRDSSVCLEVCDGADIVFHLASKVGGIGYYQHNPAEVILENSLIDSNMLTAALGKNVKKYFYASSAHVYPNRLQQTPDARPIREEDAYPANPGLSYGWAKLLAEKQLEYVHEEKAPIGIAIARLIGIYGGNQDIGLETGSVIPVFSRRAFEFPKNGPFVIWGTGEETRSFCFIDDAIDCMKSMVEALEAHSLIGPLNVGRSDRIKIVDLARMIIRVSGKNIEPEFDISKNTLIWGQLCDCSRAEKELNGWRAETSFAQGLLRVYEDVARRAG